MVALARLTLVHEWRRFLPAIIAVGFAGLLQLLQTALVLGIFGSTSVYITGSTADLWVGYPGTQSVNLGRPINADGIGAWRRYADHLGPLHDRLARDGWIDPAGRPTSI